MSTKSLYIGNAKQINLKSGDFALKASICLDDLWAHLKITEGAKAKSTARNGKKYVKIALFPMKEARDWGTHSVKLDLYEPPPKEEPKEEPEEDGNELPF